MFIFTIHLNCVLKLCDHKSCYEEASVFSWTWFQGMEQSDAFVYILISISKFCSLHKSESQNITTLFLYYTFINRKVSL